MVTFMEVYSEHYERVKSLAIFKTNKEVGEEIANDVFVRVDEHLSNYDEDKSKMSTWLTTITNRLIIDYWRKQKNDLKEISISGVTDEVGKEVFQVTSWTNNPERQMIIDEKQNALLDCIDSLESEKYRKIAELYFIKEYSYDECVKALNLNLNTVKVNIMRARALLQGMIKQKGLI
jgi:RNA polymerase sigma-70 factor (ECF subfamily)